MADKIQLRVVTPSRMLLDEEVDEVTAPGELGEFGVLPNHIAFLSTLVPGEVSYKQGQSRTFVAVGGGYAEVLDNVMTILTPTAEFAGEIDTERAERAKERAERSLSELDPEDKDWKTAAVALQRAHVRLQVARREARR
jgi:F-type H+-transporting ATPase subunit epsilon